MRRYIMFLYSYGKAHGGFDDILRDPPMTGQARGEIISFDVPQDGQDYLPHPQENITGYDAAHVVDTQTWKIVMTYELHWRGRLIEGGI